MKNKAKFDFELIAYERLLKIFPSYVKTGRTIPIRGIYRKFGLLYSLTKQQTRLLLKAMAGRFEELDMNCHGVKIKNRFRS